MADHFFRFHSFPVGNQGINVVVLNGWAIINKAEPSAQNDSVIFTRGTYYSVVELRAAHLEIL
jgi:hypothetical protein